MRYLRLTLLLVTLALAGCGGDDDADNDAAASGSTSSSESTATSASTSTSGSVEPLQFEQVEGFTLDYLEAEAAVSKECNDLAWVQDEKTKRELAPFTGTDVTELLTCDDVPYLAYLEYEDATAAEEGLAPALLPYLLADESTVVMPMVAIDEATATAYLEAFEAECTCGEIVKPPSS